MQTLSPLLQQHLINTLATHQNAQHQQTYTMQPTPEGQSMHQQQTTQLVHNRHNNAAGDTNTIRVLRSDNSPLVRSIREYLLQVEANIPEITKYDGTRDLNDHIENYRWTMDSYYMDEKYWCIFFSTTLSGPTQLWYKCLST